MKLPVDPKALVSRVVELEQLLIEARIEARTDGLTRLHNRRAAEEMLARTPDVVVALLDLDHFKHINDTHGHDVGDEVLRVVGRTLRRFIRGGDRAFRFGGEEFLVALPNTTLANAHKVIERLLRAVRHATAQILGFEVSFSAGVARGAGSCTGIHSADRALYLAKSAGRNRVTSAVPNAA